MLEEMCLWGWAVGFKKPSPDLARICLLPVDEDVALSDCSSTTPACLCVVILPTVMIMD